MFRHRSLERLQLLVLCLLSSAVVSDARAEDVILHLKSGDRISGLIVSENTNRVVVSNSWTMELSVPLNEIARRERVLPPSLPVTDAEFVAAKIQPPKTNHLKGEVQLGLDLRYGATDRQNYYGRFKLGYEKPYRSNPRKFFRNGFDFSAEYGKTEGPSTSGGTNTGTQSVVSSDRMYGANKTTFDLNGNWYAYNLIGAGYNHVKKIDFEYEAGPGAGYHLIALTNFTMNLESGLNYQAQYRSDNNPDVHNVYYRLAEDVTWKIRDRLSLAERFEFFPRYDFQEYRMRFESTLSYEIYRNFSLNLIVIDLFDTAPADDVDQNEVQFRAALGIKF